MLSMYLRVSLRLYARYKYCLSKRYVIFLATQYVLLKPLFAFNHVYVVLNRCVYNVGYVVCYSSQSEMSSYV